MKSISPVAAKTMLSEEKSAVLLDVRTRDEFLLAHISGSTLIPLNVLEKEVQQQIPDYATPIIVYCQSGGRSSRAATILATIGYANVFNMGGIVQWPYGTVSGI